eukprot:6270446-Prymnesium_polylepis.2
MHTVPWPAGRHGAEERPVRPLRRTHGRGVRLRVSLAPTCAFTTTELRQIRHLGLDHVTSTKVETEPNRAVSKKTTVLAHGSVYARLPSQHAQQELSVCRRRRLNRRPCDGPARLGALGDSRAAGVIRATRPGPPSDRGPTDDVRSRPASARAHVALGPLANLPVSMPMPMR